MNEQERARALDIARRYGGEHLAPAALERDILLFGPDSFLLARRDGEVYYISHLVGPPKELLGLFLDLARALRERGEAQVPVRGSAKHPLSRLVARAYGDRLQRVGDFYESRAELWP